MPTNEIQFDQSADLAERTFYKNAPAAVQGAGTWHSYWKASGLPSAGIDPSSAKRAFSSDALAANGNSFAALFGGGVVLPAKRGALRYLKSFGVMCSQAGSIMLYDRIADADGLNLASATAQTACATPAGSLLQRHAWEGEFEASKLEAWIEVTTATATTAPTVQPHLYTNQDGVAGKVGTAVALPAAVTVAGSMIPLALANTDRGVQSVEGVTVGSAASAGAANVVIIRRLLVIPIPTANTWVQVSAEILAKVGRIKDGAVLALAHMNASGTTPGSITGKALFSYG